MSSDPARAQKRARERADLLAIGRAVDRYLNLDESSIAVDRVSIVIRLIQVRASDPEALDFPKLADSPDGDLLHDVSGMLKDYRTFGSSGRLPPLFVPRCTRSPP